MPPLAVIVAAALDLALGDPPNRLHPVAWMGRAIAGGRRALCRGGRAQLAVGAALVTLAVAAVAAAAGLAVATLAARLGSAGPLVRAPRSRCCCRFAVSSARRARWRARWRR